MLMGFNVEIGLNYVYENGNLFGYEEWIGDCKSSWLSKFN